LRFFGYDVTVEKKLPPGPRSSTASAGATFSTAAAAVTAPLTLLAANASLAASALATVAASSASSGLGGFFGDIFGNSGTWGGFTRAGGGLLGRNQPALVGENGPEIFVPRVAGRIFTNQEFQRERQMVNRNTVVNVNVPATMNRQSSGQIGLEVWKYAQRAAARDG
jgi:hypothetical protein